jgi:hypothetical protein
MILLARNMQRNLRKSFYAQGLSQWQLWLSSARTGLRMLKMSTILAFSLAVGLYGMTKGANRSGYMNNCRGIASAVPRHMRDRKALIPRFLFSKNNTFEREDRYIT